MTADATRLRQAVRRWSGRVADAAVDDTARRARQDGQVPRGETGDLRASIRKGGVGLSGATSVTTHVVAPVIQAATTDKGARPHRIRPRRAGGVLVFHWPKAGRVVAFRHVNHPGNRPANWWRPVLLRSWTAGLKAAARRTPLT